MDDIQRAIDNIKRFGAKSNGHVIGQPKPVGQVSLVLLDNGSMTCQWTCEDLLAVRLLAKAISVVFDKIDQANAPKVVE